ncbi:hypothetical protein [Streptomyces sp. SID5643]|uniref:hypothetical protein n=1 Tax=Streptomyces sp. SID5643 TaxID=2690307 RepID=UPI001370DE26|nr:hypothetical protein [Streptomyces sp. SID5643]MZF85064.1 hypothetical protein [Streptomyces sp. SID5643]
MSETSVVLISSGAVLAASAITGGLTWLAGRSNLVRQLVDQKETRHEQHRREVYTSCLEALSTMLALTQEYGASRVTDGDDGARELRSEITSHLNVQFRQMSAVQLVGPDAVVDSFTRAHSALMDFAEFIDRLPPVGSPSRPSDPYQEALPYLEAVSEAVDGFGRAARAALGFS